MRGQPANVWTGAGLACLAILSVCCASSEAPEATDATVDDLAADRQAILDAHQALVTAYQNGDTDGFVLVLDKSDDLLLYHPRLEDRWHGIDEIQKNLPRMFARLGKATWLDVHLDVAVQGNIGWITSHIVIESPDVEEPFTGRGTEIWVRRSKTWRLVHGHWSSNPEF